MTVTEQLKELLQKVKNIQGQQLTLSKRVKALEELPKVEGIDIGVTLNEDFLNWYAETFPDKVEVIEKEIEEVEEPVEEDEEIPEEVIEELEEVINGDS